MRSISSVNAAGLSAFSPNITDKWFHFDWNEFAEDFVGRPSHRLDHGALDRFDSICGDL